MQAVAAAVLLVLTLLAGNHAGVRRCAMVGLATDFADATL
jgi:hypothetical protein